MGQFENQKRKQDVRESTHSETIKRGGGGQKASIYLPFWVSVPQGKQTVDVEKVIFHSYSWFS